MVLFEKLVILAKYEQFFVVNRMKIVALFRTVHYLALLTTRQISICE